MSIISIDVVFTTYLLFMNKELENMQLPECFDVMDNTSTLNVNVVIV